MKAVIVTGGRNYLNVQKVFDALDKLSPTLVITGACPSGADQYAERWAKANERNYIGFPAKWATHGKSAGPRRNREIVDFVTKFDLNPQCLAFPGGTGTADMVQRCVEKGMLVQEVGDGD